MDSDFDSKAKALLDSKAELEVLLDKKLKAGEEDEPTKKKYNNPDAFKLMWYRCGECGMRERIWNGRNNVSPFGTGCSVQGCKGSATHIDWHLDVTVPLYQPPPGSRYFADFTRKRAEEVAAQMIKLYKGTEYEVEVGTKEYNDLYWENVHRLMNGDCSMDILIAEG